MSIRKDIEKILKESELAWWEWDLEKNVVSTNELKLKMLDYDPQDFVGVGYQSFTDLLHSDDYERTMKAMRDFMIGEANLYQIDYRIKKASGEYTWFMDRGYAIERDDQNNISKIRGIVLDLGQAFSIKDFNTMYDVLFQTIRNSLPTVVNQKDHITLCSVCKKIKLKENGWISLHEKYQGLLSASISHGICPKCIQELYGNDFSEQELKELTSI